MLLRTFQEYLTEGKLKVHSVVHKGQHIGTVWHSKGVVAGEHIHGARFSDMSGTRNKKERMAAIALRMAKHHDSLVKEEKEPKSLMFSAHDKGRRCPECGKAKGLKHKADCSKRQKPLKESVYVVKAVHRQTGETKKFPVRALMKRAPHIHMRDIKAKVAKVFDNHEITVEPHKK